MSRRLLFACMAVAAVLNAGQVAAEPECFGRACPSMPRMPNIADQPPPAIEVPNLIVAPRLEITPELPAAVKLPDTASVEERANPHQGSEPVARPRRSAPDLPSEPLQVGPVGQHSGLAAMAHEPAGPVTVYRSIRNAGAIGAPDPRIIELQPSR